MQKEKNVTIRPLRQGDAGFLCSIFKGNEQYYDIFFDSEWDLSVWEDRVTRFISQTDIRHFVVEADCGPVGWLSFVDEGRSERELGILVISKENLRCGYGAKSLSWLIEKSRKEHIHTLLLNVNQSNIRAIQFYKQFGFEIVAEEIIPQCNDAVNLAQYKMKMALK